MRTRFFIWALGVAGVTCLIAGLAAAVAGPAAAAPVESRDPARASLQPWPITLTVRTVPALPGVEFTFDGVQLVTNQQGVTSFTQRHDFSAHTLGLSHTEVAVSGRRYTFLRWAGQRDPNQAFRPTVHGLPMRADYTVTASFATACPVSPRLVEENGTPLPAGEVSRITLLNSLGQNVNLSPTGRTWLPCGWPVYRDSLLSSRSLQYSVQSVIVSGTNVVHGGVERFSPSQTSHLKITGFFYALTITAHDAVFGSGTNVVHGGVERFSPSQTSHLKITGFFYALTITAHDAVFGSSLGDYALLTMPDRTVRKVGLGPRHTATIGDLPLGDYQVRVKAGSASVSAVTVHLSRDRTANLTAVTRTDILIVCVALGIGVAGAPLLSRTRRSRVRGRIRRVGSVLRRGRHQTREEAG